MLYIFAWSSASDKMDPEYHSIYPRPDDLGFWLMVKILLCKTTNIPETLPTHVQITVKFQGSGALYNAIYKDTLQYFEKMIHN